jgi:predicted nuclease with RNAse H fold
VRTQVAPAASQGSAAAPAATSTTSSNGSAIGHASTMAPWLGVDVGGVRKGFDVALVDDRTILELESRLHRDEVVALVDHVRPTVVAIDSPCRCAHQGHTSRKGERLLAKTVCGIRWTPDVTRVHASDYYGWIVEGLALYDALDARDVKVIEVFPTASWTRWSGPRSGRRRAPWSRDALAALGLDGVPTRTNQDQRDAIAAAVTASQYTGGATEQMGEIVVPTAAS